MSTKTPYSNEEDRFISDNWDKLRGSEIAMILGRYKGSLMDRAKRLSLGPQPQHVLERFPTHNDDYTRYDHEVVKAISRERARKHYDLSTKPRRTEH